MLEQIESHKYSELEVNQSLSDADKIEFLRQMVRIRRFEEASLKYYNAGKMGGFLPVSYTHLTLPTICSV